MLPERTIMKWICGIAFPVLVVGISYLSLRFFSRLVNVDMVSAMCWGFKAKRFELTITWCVFCPLAVIVLLALFMKPLQTVRMNQTHIGGLIGYAESDDRVMIYDPLKREYKDYQTIPAPQAASSFDETFEIIVMYRPMFSDYYQNVFMQGYFVSIFFFCIVMMFLAISYIILYALAKEYISASNLDLEVTHLVIRENFRFITGFKFTHGIGVLIILFSLLTYISASMAGRITSRYEKRFSSFQKELRDEILAKVVPGQTVVGHLVSRIEGSVTVSDSSDSSRNRTVSTSTYNVEFNGLIKYTPVYLSIKYTGSANSNSHIKLLDQLIKTEQTDSADNIYNSRGSTKPPEIDFLIKDDYSIALME